MLLYAKKRDKTVFFAPMRCLKLVLKKIKAMV